MKDRMQRDAAQVKPSTEDVPVRRPYDVSGRQQQARAKRRGVLVAAQRLFEERGYAATAITDVARAAAVSPEYIYKGLGSKAALLKEVFDFAIGGDDEQVAVADRPESQSIRDEPDPRQKLRLFAEQGAVRARRSAAIQLVVRNGAASDPALQQLWDKLTQERLLGMTMLARHLSETGALRVGPDEARDVLFSCISIEVFDLFVRQRGWSVDAYAEWLRRTLVASLVDV